MNDTSALATHIPELRRALARTLHDARGATERAAAYTVAWHWMALVSGLFVLDLLFGLPAPLRWAALLGQVGYVAWGVRGILAHRAREQRAAEWAARAVEERHPELDNALINAVQFEASLSRADAVQAVLMQREMLRAESAIAALPGEAVPGRDAELRALRTVAYFGSAWLAIAVLFSSGFLAVVPRIFLPWLDELTPPFSLTRYDVRPAGATIRAGESLNIRITVTGPVPADLVLMTRATGAGWRRIAMENLEPGKYAVTLTSLQEDTFYYAQGGSSRSARYRIRVVSAPKVKELKATYAFPAYTRRPAASMPLPEEGIRALHGTSVTLVAVSNRPLRGGALHVRTVDGTEQVYPVAATGPDQTHGTAGFTLSRPGEFRLALVGEDSQVNETAWKGKITVDRDERPNVWFSHPGQDLLVTPSMRVPLLIEAEDDHGVQRIEVHRLINDLGDSPRSFPTETPQPQFSQRLLLDLSELGLRPGDVIKYYGVAVDNEPSHPNFGETEPYTINVVTPEEYQRALEDRSPEEVTDQPKDMARAVPDLAERQERLAKEMERLLKELQKNPSNAEAQRKFKQAQADQKALQSEARELAREMKEYAQSPSSSALERALKQAIGQMAEQLSAAAEGSMQQAQGSPGASAKAAEEAKRQLQRLERRMEEQIQKALENLEKVYPLFNDVERFMALLDRQGQLVLKSREYEQKSTLSKSDKARLEELQRQQGLIREELRQLQADFRTHADAAEKDFPRAARSARKIAEEIGRRQIVELMQEGQDHFRQWNGREAVEKSREPLAQLEAMVSQCRAGQGQMQGELDISLSRLLGQSGLGGSMRQFARGMGRGQGNGRGMGFGSGGLMSGPSGSTASGSTRSARAYVPGTQRVRGGGGGNRKKRSQNRIAGEPAGLAPEDIEIMRNPASKKPKADDSDASRYPAEYKKLIGEYFRSVAERQ